MDEFARERRIFTPIDEIPDQVKDAFISAEDKNFYEHHGFDPRGIAAAVYDAAAHGGRLRGASTITQQVMKNFLLTGDRSGERKIKEIILATRLESTLSKDEILAALPERDLPRAELLRRHRRGAGLFRQVAGRADASRRPRIWRRCRRRRASCIRCATRRARWRGATTCSIRWRKRLCQPRRRRRREGRGSA